jgi:DNA end-binding protein Ku
MPRSLWNGTVSIGPVHVPVKLFSATEDKAVHFRQVHLPDGARIEHRRRCTADGEEVPYEDVVKGYEVAPDEYVVLSKDEVKAAAGARGKIIDVEHFVPAADVDPVWFAKPYLLGAQDKDPGAPGAYAALAEALQRTGRMAVGRFTFHDRERLVAIGVRDGLLVLHQLHFADEVVGPDEVEIDEPGKPPRDREIDMAERLVEGLHHAFDPAELRDEHREAVLELIDRKAAGEKLPEREDEPAEETDDLLAALEASLQAARS